MECGRVAEKSFIGGHIRLSRIVKKLLWMANLLGD